jgi:hypothetical protein
VCPNNIAKINASQGRYGALNDELGIAKHFSQRPYSRQSNRLRFFIYAVEKSISLGFGYIRYFSEAILDAMFNSGDISYFLQRSICECSRGKLIPVETLLLEYRYCFGEMICRSR